MFGFLTSGMIEGIEISRPLPKAVRRKRWRRKRWHQRIYWRDNGTCVYCETPISYEDSTIDHVMPLVRGGSDFKKENMVLACFSCNHKKGPLEICETEHYDLSVGMLKAKWVSLDKAVR